MRFCPIIVKIEFRTIPWFTRSEEMDRVDGFEPATSANLQSDIVVSDEGKMLFQFPPAPFVFACRKDCTVK